MTVPQPGCVPLRPLGLGDILDGAFTMIRRNPRVTLGLSSVLAAVQVLIVVGLEVLTYTGLGRVTVTGRATATASTGLGPLLGGEYAQLVTLVISAVLGAVLTGLLTVAITQDVLGGQLSTGEVWRRTRRRIRVLLAVAVLATLGQYAGLVLVIVGGVWLWGIWAVAVPALMVEDVGVRAALRRSRRLVRGEFWRVWWTRVMALVVALVVNLMITVPFAAVGLALGGDPSGTGRLPLVFALLTAVGAAVASAATAPIRAGVDVLLYLDLRMRREGLDIVLLGALAPARAAAATVGPAPRTAF